MPSKAIAAETAEASSEILVLINLIRTATEFKADMKEMATICKISHEKNVPRKINAVIAPYGFKFERGRITEQAGSVADKGQGEDGEKAVKTPAKTIKQPAKTIKQTAKTPGSRELNTPNSKKKRKLEEEEEPEESEDDVVKNENGISTDAGAGASNGNGVKPMAK